MTIYGKVLCHQPATLTFNEGFSNGSRRSFINTGFLYMSFMFRCPCHMLKSPAGGFYGKNTSPEMVRIFEVEVSEKAWPGVSPRADDFQKFENFRNF
ncbi:hypothetical protein T4A_7830 [Trichinella pseudospiralis]|uniref:Uncharacterized protein n=1 Tax=Trichinella pseudospiralis TaxID=6337 RepID=A0A0V1DT45_TRIPS|nr:hypothetical protein T4A_7830 [Trichinella pseudospiralis]